MNNDILNSDIENQKIKTPHYQCSTCEQQCAGHGGGDPSWHGGCLCNDGIYLECLI